MPMPSKVPSEEEAKQGALSYARAWGVNPLPPTVLATLITAQHMRPFQALPMLFPPILMFSTYLNLHGFKKDSAGLTSAWSMAYFVLASRRKAPLMRKFGARGIVRGATMALCVANAVGGGWAYWTGNREKEDSIV
ncbi:hypothetical protein AC579_502 [Pseudocercospora musae]|uniref:Altered inheritance of mitochondria protein 19 n=1 Tax=Pseudocercospora musae TaxID=113226 RepID=A0A139I5V2_9PEZI|nr:hypothetical protein AC579_502 [Pseudocercospora musae]KXT10133.1 hypothetical protein AC579_502 [Pseudocercospora musae]KXT10137.1 hypothetical protein AC579_502 [Pseudocercospora musae]